MMGVHGLVSFDGEPAVVPRAMIRKIEDQLAEIDRAGGINLEGFPIEQPGEKVNLYQRFI